MAARFSDFAWQSAQRLVDGAGRRTVRRGFCDLMAAGCRIVHNFSGSDYVCLTFDDGPTQQATLDILEALKRHDVPATFYCVGENVLRYPQLAKAMAEVGHEIGNHTMTHPDLYRLSPRNLSREIEACQRVLRQTCGVQVPTFRAPYGHFRWDMRWMPNDIYHLVKWDVFPNWYETAPDVLAEMIVRSAKGGSIIVLHDGLTDMGKDLSEAVGRAAAKTVDLIVPQLKAKGLRFATVSAQLAKFSAVTDSHFQ